MDGPDEEGHQQTQEDHQQVAEVHRVDPGLLFERVEGNVKVHSGLLSPGRGRGGSSQGWVRLRKLAVDSL